MHLVRKLERLGGEIADIASAIYVATTEVELHEQEARKHRAAVAEYRRQHGDDAEIPPVIRHGLDLAERLAIEARAEQARLRKSLAEARSAFITAHPAPLTATRIVDEAIENALGPMGGKTSKSGL